MTAEEIINKGVSTSYVNRPETLALGAVELLEILNSEIEEMLHSGVRANPWYFAVTTSLPYSGGSSGWVLPSHEMLLRVELSTGEPVTVISMGERVVTSDDLPKLYYVRGVLQPTVLGTTATVLTSEVLSVLYTPVLSRLTATSQSPDAYAIPERHQAALAYRIAAYLAAKDGRDDDQARFESAADRHLARYLSFLTEHQSAVARFYVPVVQPVSPAAGAA